MAYLLNNKVSEKSTIKQALTRIFGVGPFLADSFCKKVELGKDISSLATSELQNFTVAEGIYIFPCMSYNWLQG